MPARRRKNKTGTATHHIAGVPTGMTAFTEAIPQPGTFWLSIAYSTAGRSDIGQVQGLDSHGWWFPAEFVSPEW